MKRVNQHQFYQLGLAVHPLTGLGHADKISEVMWQLVQARNWLNWFLSDNVVPLVVSKPYGYTLTNAIDQIIPTDFPSTMPEKEDEAIGYRGLMISSAAKEFEIVLAAELQSLDTYFVSQKGIYSTPDLIEHADKALDEAVRKTLHEEALNDFRQAGRCLAFDLSTAAGFHAMRATENVLRQYHQVILNAQAPTKLEMGPCIKDLKDAGADAKTLEILDQIRDLHRNPLMHPEVFLTPSEGLRLFDIAKSAISAMADEISKASSKLPTILLRSLAGTTPPTKAIAEAAKA
jgi:hypothetical protein